MPVYPVNGLGKYPVYTDTGQLHELPAGGLLLPCQSQEHMLRPDAATPRMARLSRCDRVYVTKVDSDPDADSFFPNLDDNPDWRIDSESEVFEENGLKFQYVDYVRN